MKKKRKENMHFSLNGIPQNVFISVEKPNKTLKNGEITL